MPTPIIRKTLAQQTADGIRNAIQRGDYKKHLPAERTLSRDLNVSRPTLRSALKLLLGEGIIEREDSSKALTIKIKRKRKVQKATTHVRFLEIEDDEHPQDYALNARIRFLTEHFQERKVDFSIESLSGYYRNSPAKALERLLGRRHADLWILRSCTYAVQRWFWRQNIPCVIMGSSYKGIGYDSIDRDNHAICRHAAGMLIARGHQSLAVIHPSSSRMGDVLSLEGFQEGVQISSNKRVTLATQACTMSRKGICNAVDSLLADPARPDGWFILHPTTYMTVCTYLARLGIVIGKQISLICEHPDPHFEHIVPSAAHYQCDDNELNRQFLKLLCQKLDGAPSENRKYFVISHFKPGESLR